MEPPQALLTLARWLKEDGAFVIAGEAICEMETDKASMEIAAWTSGRLRHLAKVGDVVTDGDAFARID